MKLVVGFLELVLVGATVRASALFGLQLKGVAPRGCPFDHAPCECLNDGTAAGYQITCVNVTAAVIRGVFNRSDVEDHSLLRLEGNFTSLPADLLAGKRVKQVIMKFYKPTPGLIDEEVLRSSADYTTSIDMSSSEATVLDMSFLSNFSALQTLTLTGQWTVFTSVPQLPSLTQLLVNSPGYQTLLDARDMYRNSLQRLTITGVNMQKVPPEIQEFDQLTRLDLSSNNFGSLPNGSVSVSAKLNDLRFYNAQIKSVEPEAFQGDFSATNIDLGYHMMNKFEELAFRHVLQSMEDAQSDGNIYLSSNYNFVCDCHLTWLLVDNRHLLHRVRSAYCHEQATGAVFSLEDYDINKLATCSGGTSTQLQTTTLSTQSASTTSSSSQLVASFAQLFLWLLVSLAMQSVAGH